jgi:sugar phosphate isomerase/epimerase
MDEDVECVLAAVRMSESLRPAVVVATLGQLGSGESTATANAREAIGAVAGAADAAGVRIALNCRQQDIALMESLLADMPGAPFGVVLDPGAALFAGRDPVEAAAVTKDVLAVRASDSTADEADLPPGRGRVPWRDFLAALASRDYDSFVTVAFKRTPDAPAAAAAAFGLLRKAGF